MKRSCYLPFKLVLLAALIAFLSKCDCNYHLKKAALKCGKTSFTDTIRVRDTIFVNSVTKDTVFNYRQTDTVVIKEGRLTMRYFYNTHDSTVYLRGKCDTVFIPFEIKVPFTTTILNFDYWAWIKHHIWWLLLFLGIVAIVTMLLKTYWPFKK